MSATIFAVRGRLEFIPTWMRRVGLKPDLQQRLDPVGLKPDLQRRLHRVGLKPDLQGEAA